MNLDSNPQSFRSGSERTAKAATTLEPAGAVEHRTGNAAAAEAWLDLPGF